MLHNLSITSKTASILQKLLPLLAFIIPIIILYFLDPVVFEKTWKGRMFYVFFLWLISLELILSWEGLQTERIKSVRSIRTGALIAAFFLPIIYVVVSNFYGLNVLIENLSRQVGIFWADVMPLSTEYLVFALFFFLIVLLEYGFRGLKIHSISFVFLAIIGAIYTIDNVYMNNFTPFQILVPTTASLAANFLNFLGYPTLWGSTTNYMPTLIVPGTGFSAQIAWPCSGIESLLIYSVTILLFLKYSMVPWRHGIAYFLFGAGFTYFINVLRIVNIFIIGANGGNVWPFHDIYGQLYSISWIAFYPLLIMASRAFLETKRPEP